MGKKRIEYPGPIINNGDAENYFDFFDNRMRNHYLRAVDTMLEGTGYEGKVLDIGCGAGVFGVRLCDKTEYFKVHGLEKSATLVRISEAISSRIGYGRRISPKIWNDDKLPFPDGEFDAVVSLFSMHRWGNCETIFSEIERVRKKNSLVYITDFHREFTFAPFYVYALRSGMAAGRGIFKNLINSHKASYTTGEINSTLNAAGLNEWNVAKKSRILTITSAKNKSSVKAGGQP
ncbi:MAG: class I SAM-dependent methyltransferase [candidate division Zixibacteria bacterium]